MKMIKISENVPAASAIGLGCMRLTSLEGSEAVRKLVDTALEAGINFFDHADIYAGGEAEAEFGKALLSKNGGYDEIYHKGNETAGIRSFK